MYGKRETARFQIVMACNADRSDKVIQPESYSPGEILSLFQPPWIGNSLRPSSLQGIVLPIPVLRVRSIPECCPDRTWPIGRAAHRSACVYLSRLDCVQVRTDTPAAAPRGRVRSWASLESYLQGSGPSLGLADCLLYHIRGKRLSLIGHDSVRCALCAHHDKSRRNMFRHVARSTVIGRDCTDGACQVTRGNSVSL